jgi:hypothetical protein
MTCPRYGGRALSAVAWSAAVFLAFGACAAAHADDQHGKVQVKGPTSVTANPSSGINLSSGLLLPQIKSSAAMRSALRAASSTGGSLGPGDIQETLRPGATGVAQPSSAPGPGGPDPTTVKRVQAQPLPK